MLEVPAACPCQTARTYQWASLFRFELLHPAVMQKDVGEPPIRDCFFFFFRFLLFFLVGSLVGWSIGDGPGESESGGVGLGPVLWASHLSLEDSG